MSCLLCVSFLDWSGVVASIQLDSVLVENAEYGTSASESAGSPDFIYRMSCNIEVHYSLLSVELLHLAGRNRRQRHNHLLLQLDQNVLLTDNLIVMRHLRQDNTCSGTILLQRYELYSEMDSYCLVLLGQQTSDGC